VLIIFGAGGFDAGVHISEEASNASVAVPTAIVAAPVTAAILGFGTGVLSFMF
jgi:hypothetical protein